MKEFKEPGVSLLRRDRLVATGIGIAAFVVYACTMSPGLHVGESMWSSARALGYAPVLSPVNAVQFWLAGVCMRLLHFTLGANIHLFGALVGALCAALLFRLVSFFTYQVIHEEHCARRDGAISLVAGLGTALAFAFSPGGWYAATRFTIHLVDLLMLLSALCLFVFYARRPAFAWLLALAALYGAGVAQSAYFILFAPLAALGCVLALWRNNRLSLPRASWLTSAFLAGMVASYALTALVFAATRDTAAAGETAVWIIVKGMILHSYEMILSLMRLDSWLLFLLASPAPWFIALFIAGRTLNNERLWSHYALHIGMTAMTAAALLGMRGSPWLISQGNPRAMIPLFSYVMVAMTTGYLLAYWYLLMTVRRGSRSVVDPNSPVFLMGRPIGQIFFFALAAFAVAAGAFNYFRRVDGSKERFINEVAGEILARLENRDWLILNSKVDANYLEFNLRHIARKDGRRLNVINMLAPERNQAITAAIMDDLIPQLTGPGGQPLTDSDRQFMINSLNLGILTFITDLYAHYPDFTRDHVVNWETPDMIMNSGIRPIPEFVYFGSGLSWRGKTPRDMLGEYRDFLERMDALLPHTEKPASLLDHLCNDLRRHMGFVVNNYAVALADSPTLETPPAEKDEIEREAYALFKRIVAFSPENISARINVFQIAYNSQIPEIQAEKDEEGARLQDYVDSLKNNRYTIYAITSHYGYVRSKEIYEMILKMYARNPGAETIVRELEKIIFPDLQDPDGESPERVLSSASPEQRLETMRRLLAENPANARLYYEITRLCIRQGQMEEAEKWIREAERRNLGIDFSFEHATLLLNAGKVDEARTILLQLTRNKKHYEALTMLAFIMLDQQDVVGVQRSVLDTIEREEGNRKGYYYQLVSGKLKMLEATIAAAKKNDSDAVNLQREARDHYFNAYKARPEVEALGNLVLELDFALNDRANARSHARSFLQRNRNHPMASWVLGSLLFMDGDYPAAEQYFKQSVEARPEARALNDYAEVLRRLNKPAEAERHAREALRAADAEKQPRYASAAYDTLARALLAQNKVAEAKTASNEAIKIAIDGKIPFNNAQLKLTQLQIAVAGNATSEARELANEIQAEIKLKQELKEDSLDKEEKAEFNSLLEQVSKM